MLHAYILFRYLCMDDRSFKNKKITGIIVIDIICSLFHPVHRDFMIEEINKCETL